CDRVRCKNWAGISPHRADDSGGQIANLTASRHPCLARSQEVPMPSSSDRDALIDALLADLKRKLQAELPDDTATLDQIEDAAHKIGGDLARELQRQIVHRRSRGPRDNQSACPRCHPPLATAT